MSDGFAALFWGVLTFSLLIVVHEGGHFLTARMFGVKVHEFMIGLPGPAIRLKGKKTTYGITAIPLGGYVRIAGMEPGPEEPMLADALAMVTQRGQANAFILATDLGIEEAEADRLLITLADWDAIEPLAHDPETYRSRFRPDEAADRKGLLDRARSVTYRSLPTWKRIVVLSAGVVLNLITAVAVFAVVISIVGTFTTRVSQVAEDSAAAAAGIEVGDRIVSIDGKRTRNWQNVIDTMAGEQPGTTAIVVIERDGQTREVEATFTENPETGGALLGVSPTVEKPGVLAAIVEAISYIGLTFAAILKFFNPQTASQALGQSASIIGASYMAADAARTSALNYAAIVAMLSLSLGVINIFPIPPLDGGKVMVELIERFRGRPLSRNFSLGLSATGAILLFALIAFLMYADVVRYIVN